MTKPVFILGKHRSGTTWLANQLCQHSMVAGITHSRHFGICESGYFTYVNNRYGDLARKSNFVEFVEVISASDYFRLGGASKEFLYSLWPATYEEIFRAVMDNYAVKQNAVYWLEKSPSHSILAHQLAAIYPDAKFISIERDVEATVASTIALSRYEKVNGPIRQRTILYTVLSWTMYAKILKSFSSQTQRIKTVRYDALRSDLKSTLQNICNFLELPFEPKMCEQAFSRNSSFQNNQREFALSNNERILVRSAQRLFEIIPMSALHSVHRFRAARNRQSLPNWYFLMHPSYEMLQNSNVRDRHKENQK